MVKFFEKGKRTVSYNGHVLGQIDGFTLESRPTEEGLLRYEPNGLYTANGNDTSCTCEPSCPDPCKGGCGCDACSEAYGDFLSSQGE